METNQPERSDKADHRFQQKGEQTPLHTQAQLLKVKACLCAVHTHT